MKRLLSILTKKSFWIFILLVTFSLLIWYIGAVLAIGSYTPLASAKVRLNIIVGIFILWLLISILRKYLKTRRDKHLNKEIQALTELVEADDDYTENKIEQKFEDLNQELKAISHISNYSFIKKRIATNEHIYYLPWFVVIGDIGSGKTTLIKESDLEFPLDSTADDKGVIPPTTDDFNWFIEDNAVLLDTSGRFIAQPNQEDVTDWNQFVELLSKYRPQQPINGLIVTIDIEEILQPKINFKVYSKLLRKRMREMKVAFKMNFPVYLVITKLDKLKGFIEFFESLNDDQQKNFLGFTLPITGDEHEPVDQKKTLIKVNLAKFESIIEASYLNQINNFGDVQAKNNLFTFSNEFALLSEKIILLFDELFRSSKYLKSVSWRGLFFTSALQDGQTLDPMFFDLAANLELPPKPITHNHDITDTSQSYFIKDVFQKVVFNDTDLASFNEVWFRSQQIRRWTAIGAVTTGTILSSGLLLNSYLANAQYLTDVNHKASDFTDKIKNGIHNKDLITKLKLTQQIGTLASTSPFVDIQQPSIFYTMGLYQGKNVKKLSDSAYYKALQEEINPIVTAQIYNLLVESRSSQKIDSYDALKAYLMLYDRSRFDPDFLGQWLSKNFGETAYLSTINQKQDVLNTLSQIFINRDIHPTQPINSALVDTVRQELAGEDISAMILSNSLDKLTIQNINKLPLVSFVTMGGNQSKLVFSRPSGRSLSLNVNPLYTKEAYNSMVLPEILNSTKVIYAEQEWVLGKYATKNTDEKKVLNQVKQIYYLNYINEWSQYVADIMLQKPNNLAEAKSIAKILANPSTSPLKGIIDGISNNTTLSVVKPKQIASGQGSKIDLAEEAFERLMTKAGLGGVSNKLQTIESDYKNTLETVTPVDRAFQDYHSLTTPDASKKVPLNDIIASIGDLYQYLDTLSIAIDKGVDLPSDDSLYKYRTQVSKLPSPFRGMFDEFSNFILDKSINEKQVRASKAELEKQQLESQQQADAAKKAQDTKEQKTVEVFRSMQVMLQPITKLCEESTVDKYPFNGQASTDTTLANFDRLFSSKGQFYHFMTLDPVSASVVGQTTLDQLMAQDSRFATAFGAVDNVKPINAKYFLNEGDKLGFNFNYEIVNLPPAIEKLTFTYGKQSFTYSHGPVEAQNLNWPLNDKTTVGLAAFSGNVEIDKIEKTGPWSLFRFIEDGDILSSSNDETVVKYMLHNNEVIIKFIPKSNNNPFNLDEVRKFSCPKG